MTLTNQDVNFTAFAQLAKTALVDSANRKTIRSSWGLWYTAINSSVYTALCKQKAEAACVCVAVQWPTPPPASMERIRKLWQSAQPGGLMSSDALSGCFLVLWWKCGTAPLPAHWAQFLLNPPWIRNNEDTRWPHQFQHIDSLLHI